MGRASVRRPAAARAVAGALVDLATDPAWAASADDAKTTTYGTR
jgi:hypothetical protein